MDGANISDLRWALKLLHLLESYAILRFKKTHSSGISLQARAACNVILTDVSKLEDF